MDTLSLPVVGMVSCILAAFVGGGMGVVLARTLQRARVRNRALGLGLAAGVALVSLHVAWAVWTYALLRRDDVDVNLSALRLQPTPLAKLIVAVNEHGAWSLKGFTPTGALLWVL